MRLRLTVTNVKALPGINRSDLGTRNDDGRTRPIGGYARNLLTAVDDGTRLGAVS